MIFIYSVFFSTVILKATSRVSVSQGEFIRAVFKSYQPFHAYVKYKSLTYNQRNGEKSTKRPKNRNFLPEEL